MQTERLLFKGSGTRGNSALALQDYEGAETWGKTEQHSHLWFCWLGVRAGLTLSPGPALASHAAAVPD